MHKMRPQLTLLHRLCILIHLQQVDTDEARIHGVQLLAVAGQLL